MITKPTEPRVDLDTQPEVEADAEPSITTKPATPPRLRWRVLVRTGTSGKLDPSRPSRPLSWHLVTCADTGAATSHCEEGRRLLTTTDDPSGHCMLEGVCPRCGATS